MLYKTFELKFDGLTFKIEKDFPDVGVYLYVIDNGKIIKYYLQNTVVQDCKEIGLEEYGLPIKEWNKAIT